MIKIIKSGKTTLPKTKEVTCLCKCKFSFTKEDATLHLDFRDGDYYSICCPECAYETTYSKEFLN